MKCYLAGKDHKQQSSMQQESLAKEQAGARTATSYGLYPKITREKIFEYGI